MDELISLSYQSLVESIIMLHLLENLICLKLIVMLDLHTNLVSFLIINFLIDMN